MWHDFGKSRGFFLYVYQIYLIASVLNSTSNNNTHQASKFNITSFWAFFFWVCVCLKWERKGTHFVCFCFILCFDDNIYYHIVFSRKKSTAGFFFLYQGRAVWCLFFFSYTKQKIFVCISAQVVGEHFVNMFSFWRRL